MAQDYDRLIERAEKELESLENDLEVGIITYDEYKIMSDDIIEDIKTWERYSREEEEKERMQNNW